MSNRIITISREFGSGGRTIGKSVAAELGIPCYDSEMIEKIADRSGLAKEYIAEQGEYSPHDSWRERLLRRQIHQRFFDSGLSLDCAARRYTRFGAEGILRHRRQKRRLYSRRRAGLSEGIYIRVA